MDLGLDNTYYQPHLDEAILACLGLNDDTNETFERYSRIMDEHAQQIGIKQESVKEEAEEVFVRLKGITGQARDEQ